MTLIILLTSLSSLMLLHVLSLLIGWGAFYRLKAGIAFLDVSLLVSLILKIFSSSVMNLFILGLYYYSGTLIPFWHEVAWGVTIVFGIIISENCFMV